MAELKQLADHWEFEGHLDPVLRDRLVCGLRQEAIQWKLLMMTGLPRHNEMAQGLEAADLHYSKLQASTKPKPLEI